MARLTDSDGRLLGGLDGLRLCKPPASEHGMTAARAVSQTLLAPRYGPEETVPGLECSYGSLACSYTDRLTGRPPHRFACHNPVEDSEERHHCEHCGGDYCAVHAEPAAHDCAYIVLPV